MDRHKLVSSLKQENMAFLLPAPKWHLLLPERKQNEQYTLKDGEDTLFLTFEEGDTIQVESEESDFDSVYLMEWED